MRTDRTAAVCWYRSAAQGIVSKSARPLVAIAAIVFRASLTVRREPEGRVEIWREYGSGNR
jgi:hypothetical protein